MATPRQLVKIRSGFPELDRQLQAWADALNPVLRTLQVFIRPATFAGTSQPGTLYMGSGAPSNVNGANGDFFFRTDTPGTVNQRIYVKSAGAWVGIV